MSYPSPFKWRRVEAEIILLCALVPPVLAQLPRPRRDEAGAGTLCRLHDDLPLGAAIRPRARKTLSASPQSLHRFLESR
jgi:hypothetical protein